LVVVTSPLFTHKIAKGYADRVGQVVKEINGTKVNNLRHLVEILRDCADVRVHGPRVTGVHLLGSH
jgi:hypothetical protein